MDEIKNVSYFVYEAAQTRSERLMKRLTFSLVIVAGLLFVSNLVWLLILTGRLL